VLTCELACETDVEMENWAIPGRLVIARLGGVAKGLVLTSTKRMQLMMGWMLQGLRMRDAEGVVGSV